MVTLIDVSAVIKEQIFSFSGPLSSPVFVFVRRLWYGRKVERIKKRPFLPLPAKVANNWVGDLKFRGLILYIRKKRGMRSMGQRELTLSIIGVAENMQADNSWHT